MKCTNYLRGGEYIAPEVGIFSVVTEQGFEASLTTGTIEDASTENWGTL